jgi:hypothetical protein
MNVYPWLHEQELDNLNHVVYRCLDQQRSLILTTVGIINIVPFQQEFCSFNVSPPNGISKGSYACGKLHNLMQSIPHRASLLSLVLGFR